MALDVAADQIGYGGQPGGGKTDVLLGLALRHQRAILFRRTYPNAKGIVDRSREIYAQIAGAQFNENAHRWRFRSGRIIDIGSMKEEATKFNYQGRAYDLHGFDELTEFTESQFRFVTGWNRSACPEQRCRVFATFNPPVSDEGMWVIAYFAPWIDPDYRARRAAPGELRYFAMVDGREQEVLSAQPFEHAGKLVFPKSRTFIPASLQDNPYLRDSGYAATLDALPEPLRSILLGGFTTRRQDNPWQVIPSAWIAQACERWQYRQRQGPLSSVGMDVARGGQANTVVARLFGSWLAPLQIVAGVQTATGPDAAALILPEALDDVPVGIDVIGIGASAFDAATAAGAPAIPVNNGAAAASPVDGSPFTDRSGKLRFVNVRALAYWMVREALDPAGSDPLALPPDKDLTRELAVARWSLTARGVQVESKDDIVKRLGYSPDRADALTLAMVAPLLRPKLPTGKPAAGGHRPQLERYRVR